MEGVKTAGDNMTPRPGLEYISSRNDEKAATIKALVVQNEATQRELQCRIERVNGCVHTC